MTQSPSETSFKIEPATEGDWPWIVQAQGEIAWTALGRERQQEISRRSVAENVTQHIAKVRRDEGFPNLAYVARSRDGQIAGYIWVARTHNDHTGEHEASLLSQYVAEPYRGQGLGRRLMETAETWAHDQGLPRISLSVGVDTVIARRLYESLGYRVESLRMSKPLEPEPGGPATEG